MSSVIRTNADYTGKWGSSGPGLTVAGFCDHYAQEIRLSWDRGYHGIAADSMHELGHKVEREFPRIWVHLDAMDSPDFPCGSDDLHASQREARRAELEAKP